MSINGENNPSSVIPAMTVSQSTENLIDDSISKSCENELAQVEKNNILDVYSTSGVKVSLKNMKKKEGLPWKILIPYFFLQFSDYLVLSATGSYVADMVMDLKLVATKKEAGFFSGLVTTLYYVGSLLGSFLFGKLSDVYGRRPVFLLGSFTCMVSSFLAGFQATSSPGFFYYFLILRFFEGFNGNLGILKTVIGEVCPTSQLGEGMRLIGIAAGFSSIVTSIISGVLTRPVWQYPWLFDWSNDWVVLKAKDFFSLFPYFLPNLVVSCIFLISFSFGLFALPETNQALLEKRADKRRRKEEEKIRRESISNGIELPEIVKKPEVVVESPKEPIDNGIKRFYRKYIFLPQCLGLYNLLGFVQFFFQFTIPVFLFLPVEIGGLGMMNLEIGAYQIVDGIFSIFFQYFVAAKITKKIGVLNVLRIGTFVIIPSMPFIPELNLILKALPDLGGRILMWAILIFLTMWKNVVTCSMFTASLVAVNNCCKKSQRALVNGISQTNMGLLRALGPWLGNSLLSWTLLVNVYPFDIHGMFYTTCFLSVA